MDYYLFTGSKDISLSGLRTLRTREIGRGHVGAGAALIVSTQILLLLLVLVTVSGSANRCMRRNRKTNPGDHSLLGTPVLGLLRAVQRRVL